MYFSPKTSADGLVFHYDTGNTVRSYLGEPTTNVYGNWVQYTANSYEVLDNSTNYVKLLASAGTPWSGRFEATVSTGTYTVSFQHRTDNSNTTSFVIDNDAQDDNIWNATVSTTTEWQTYTSTKTHTGTGNHLLYFRRNGGDGNIYIRNVQLELKSHPTPFVAGTRSATQGLKDLTAANTIDLSNVSFDANAQMTFDGTNDTVSIPSNSSNNIAGDITMELVLNRTAGYSAAVMHKEQQYTLYVYSSGAITYADSSIWSYSTFGAYGNLTAGTYHHLVATKTGGVVKIYLDGTVIINKSFGSAITQTNNTLYVGSYDGSSDYFGGEIPVAKVYNRALTADEVARNFNAIKSRFNIG